MLPSGAWTTDISVTSGDTTTPLVIGIQEAATDGFDAGLDIPLPPAPPGSTFSAYLVSTGIFPMLQTDIRYNPNWILSTEAKEPILISWASSPVPLTITISDEVFPMTASGDVTLPSGSHMLQIQSSGSPNQPVVPASDNSDNSADPLPTATATPLPEQTAPPVPAEPLPSSIVDPEPGEIAPPDVPVSPDATALITDEPIPSPAVPAPTESGLSLVPVVGGVIIAGCVLGYSRWRKR